MRYSKSLFFTTLESRFSMQDSCYSNSPRLLSQTMGHSLSGNLRTFLFLIIPWEIHWIANSSPQSCCLQRFKIIKCILHKTTTPSVRAWRGPHKLVKDFHLVEEGHQFRILTLKGVIHSWAEEVTITTFSLQWRKGTGSNFQIKEVWSSLTNLT
jgi:hypothetical protein